MQPGFHHDPKTPDGDGASLTDRPTRTYVGVRTVGGATVAREDDRGRVLPLRPQTDVRSHSTTGFEWGYVGSGPAQLALAILADAVGADRARPLYQKFKFQVVARLAGERWELSRDEVLRWVVEHERADDAGDGHE